MKQRTPNVFVTSVMATGIALTGVGCTENVDAVPVSPATADRSISSAATPLTETADKSDIVFDHPDAKPYSPARAKAESCLFEAVQKATGYISLATDKERTSTAILYDAASVPPSILENKGVSDTYPIRMKVDFDLNVDQPGYRIEGTVDINATHPRREGTLTRPDDAVLITNSDNGKSYWMHDDTYIMATSGEKIELGQVDSEEESFKLCGMVYGNQGSAGFMTASKYTYE